MHNSSSRAVWFAEIGRDAEAVRQQAVAALQDSRQQEAQSLVRELPDFGDSDDASALLRVAVVGQYNAGKTTMIAALTGRRDLEIGAAITTTEAKAYPWNGILLHDTPGIHAGRSDHDEKSYQLIDAADLLIYVVTDEGFSDILARHFRNIAFDWQRASELLLVINKISQHGNPLETVRQKAIAACAPLTAADLRLTHVDAKDYLDADTEPDPGIAAELRRESRIDALVEAINDFVRDRELMGRWTAPLHEMAAVLRQGIDFLATDDPVFRAAQELICRHRSILRRALLAARHDLRLSVNTCLANIRALGDQLAEAMEPGAPGGLEELSQRLSDDGDRLLDSLNHELEDRINAVVQQVNNGMEELSRGQVARRVIRLFESSECGRFAGAGWVNGAEVPGEPRNWDTVRRAHETAQEGADWLRGLARGPRFVKAFTPSGVARGRLHEFVYDAGKFFGHNFRPWEAVNIAARVGRVATVASGVFAVLGPVLQHQTEAEQDRVERKLQDARASVRSEYAQIAASLEPEYLGRIDALLEETFGEVLASLDREAERMRDHDTAGSESLVGLQACLAGTEALIRRVQQNKVRNANSLSAG
jgi:hypothetical protein